MIEPHRVVEILGQKTILDTQQLGRRAFLDGLPVMACPWATIAADTPEETEKREALRLMWARGYSHALNIERYAARDGDDVADVPRQHIGDD